MTAVRWPEVTAVFGGTFDPPHLGHFEAIRGLTRHPGVRHIRIIPAGSPPLKTARTEVRHRVAMTRLMLDALKRETGGNFILDDREAISPAPSYTADTLLALRAETRELAFVIGTDQLQTLPRWNRFPDLLSLSHWIVLRRKPEDPEAIREALSVLGRSNLIRPTLDPDTYQVTAGPQTRSMKLVTTDAPALSSTGIRREIALHGKPPAGVLLPAVEHYLKEEKLYGTHSAN